MKKNILSLAVAAALTGVVAGSAQAAMHVNDKGLGEALFYPFYSTEGGNDTYVHVVNTTDVTKAVKVRFLEAHNSSEVLDFNLYLSPQDEWAGVITATGNGGAMIRTVDNSCTVPELGVNNNGFNGTKTTVDGVTTRDQPFVNFAYLKDKNNGIERSTEGYIEIIEMGQLDPTSEYGAAAVHDSAGVPANCGLLRKAWEYTAGGTPVGEWAIEAGTEGVASDDLITWDEDSPAAGGLWGYGVVINVADGTAVGYDAVAIDSFFYPENTPNLHYAPGNNLPSVEQADVLATIFDGSSAIDHLFSNGADAVSALFMADTISNDYVVDPDINASTDWVVTMPTKRFYVNGKTPVPPFTNIWSVKEGATAETACEEVGVEHWDREEAVVDVPSGNSFSPLPPQITEDGFVLCTEVSIVQFGEESALHGSDGITYGFSPSHEEGWARMSFTNDPARIFSSDEGSFSGLPVIGFAALNYQNGVLGDNVLANYAASMTHKSTQLIGEPIIEEIGEPIIEEEEETSTPPQ